MAIKQKALRIFSQIQNQTGHNKIVLCFFMYTKRFQIVCDRYGWRQKVQIKFRQATSEIQTNTITYYSSVVRR